MILAMDRFVPHVSQCVIHPTHVPLEREAQAAAAGRTADTWPGCRLFSDGENTGY